MTRRGSRGFTLFELSLVLMIVLLMAGTVPFALREVENNRYRRAQNDAIAMANGLLGSRDANGIIGDLGYVPPSGQLWELSQGRSDFHLRSNFRGVTHGWNGPYALTGVMVGDEANFSITRDPWDNPWLLLPEVALYSPGANGMPGSTGGLPDDDVKIPQFPRTAITGNLTVFAFDNDWQPLDELTAAVDVSVPTINGLTVNSCTGAWKGSCELSGITHGQRVVTVRGLAGTPHENWRGYARVFIGGGSRSSVMVRLTNWLQTP